MSGHTLFLLNELRHSYLLSMDKQVSQIYSCPSSSVLHLSSSSSLSKGTSESKHLLYHLLLLVHQILYYLRSQELVQEASQLKIGCRNRKLDVPHS